MLVGWVIINQWGGTGAGAGAGGGVSGAGVHAGVYKPVRSCVNAPRRYSCVVR